MGLLDDAIREHLELKRRRGADAGDISREESEALGPVRRGPDGAPDLSDTFVPADAAAEPPPGAPPSESDPTSVLRTTPAPEPEPRDVAPPAPEPPTRSYEPPAAPSYEPTSSTPAYEPTSSTPAYERPSPPPYEPPPPAYEPPPPAYEPPPAAYEPPAPPPPTTPTPPPSDRPWFERAHEEPAPSAFEREPQPDPGPEPEPDHPSLLSRFRVGRKPKHDPPPAAAEAPPSYEPPPLPSGAEPPSAYEPPPTPSASYAYEPPPAHEPDIVPADEEPDVEDVLEETPDFLEETPEHDRLWFEQRPPRDFDFDG